MSISLEFNNIHLSVDGQLVLNDLTCQFRSGTINAVIGPNGSGKSTFLKIASRLLKPTQGKVRLGNAELKSFSQKDLARTIALLPQSSPRPLGMMIEDLVACGRHPFKKWLGNLDKEDKRLVDQALDTVGMLDRKQQRVDVLSGGEMQRVWMAMVLAQDTPIMLLDEPTSYLDINHQLELLELVKDINSTLKKTVVWVLHDINQAMQYSHYLLLMEQGSRVFEGEPEHLNTQLLDQVFKVDTIRLPLPDGSSILHSRPLEKKLETPEACSGLEENTAC